MGVRSRATIPWIPGIFLDCRLDQSYSQASFLVRGHLLGAMLLSSETNSTMPSSRSSKRISRRSFLQATSLAAGGLACSRLPLPALTSGAQNLPPLAQFGYGDVSLSSELHEKQLRETQAVLMNLSEDGLLKPFRQMAGQPAPGTELGGWYVYDPNYDYHSFDAGFAPGATFGQWVSALARGYAITKSPEVREKVLRLNRLYAKTISGDFYEKNRFPAYCYDKLVCGLIDSHELVADPDAFSILDHTTDTALPHLPKAAVEHDTVWRPGKDVSYTWDESYTISENLFLAYQRGAGERYRSLGIQYLDDSYYDPLAEGRNVLAGRHAYSYVNSLSSAIEAYLTLGNEKYLRAAKNAFDMLTEQSFATGAWGPDEVLRAPGSGDLAGSLTNTHSSFETPCGSYAHFKLTRYLLRITRDPRYGDSMERVMYNTILGAKPLQSDGKAFYYSDYNFAGSKVYSPHRWPCCSGTITQVAADYRINTYFRDEQGVYVNLYIPSTLKWLQNGTQASLTQKSAYPFDSLITFDVTLAKPSEFAVQFRIPAWAQGASLSVNGKRDTPEMVSGTFASIRREWKTGDRLELRLPMALRLEPIDDAHPDIVALLSGPLVLFPTGTPPAKLIARDLLSAKNTGPGKWQLAGASERLQLRPFFSIEDEPYSTYFKLS